MTTPDGFPPGMPEYIKNMSSEEVDEALDKVRDAMGQDMGAVIMTAVVTNAEPYRYAVDMCASKMEKSKDLLKGVEAFVRDLRDNHNKSFEETWAAMNMVATAGMKGDTLIELFGSMATRLYWDQQPQAGTADTAAQKAKAARGVVDLANEVFGSDDKA